MRLIIGGTDSGAEGDEESSDIEDAETETGRGGEGGGARGIGCGYFEYE